MADILNAESTVGGCPPMAGPRDSRAKPWQILTSLFPARGAVTHAVTTRARFGDHPEEVWDRILFYEEVPGRASLLLRLLLPSPLRSEGDKARVGASVHCIYRGGYLVKRITRVDAPRLLQFEVTEQHLGIERCVRALRGSYEIRSCGEGAEVALTTCYHACLRPRWLWRALEKILAGRLHRHILDGIGVALADSRQVARPRPAQHIQFKAAAR